MAKHRLVVEVNNNRYDVEIFEEQKNVLRIRIGEKEYIVHIIESIKSSSENSLKNDGNTSVIGYQPTAPRIVGVERHSIDLSDREKAIFSEIPGRILKILVNEGSSIKLGDPIAVIESMKMEIEVRSPRNGVVKKILAKDGSYVDVGQPIVLLD